MRKETIAVFNGDQEIVEAIKQTLALEGYEVVGALVSDIRAGRINIIEFMNKYKPCVVIYDVAPPYRENIVFLDLLRTTLSFQDQCMIITSTNRKLLEEETKERSSVNIIGMPFDLDELMQTVNSCAEKCRHLGRTARFG